MKYFVVAAAAALFFCSGISLAQDAFPKLSEKDVAGLHLLREASYDGNSLWGYIDGGADVYLEYGFTKVLARKAEARGVGYQIDLYKMENAEAAFGIFSISSFTCAHPAEPLARYECLSRYQAQAVRGPYYLSVINDKGTDDARTTGITIARKLLAQIDSTDDAELPALFALERFDQAGRSIKFIKGRLGLQNGYPAFEPFFSDGSAYSLYIMDAHSDSSDMALALISFGSEEGKEYFITQTGFHAADTAARFQQQTAGTTTRCLWIQPDRHVIYLEHRGLPDRIRSFISAIDAFLKR